jgi:hypothetical protein
MKTKINWLIIVFTLGCTLSIEAQSVKFYGGAKAGFGIPNLTAGSITTPLNKDYVSRYGFYGGIIAEIQTSKRLSFRTEINYSSQGGKRNGLQALPLDPQMALLWQALPLFGVTPDNYMYADINSEAILNYLEIPVMAKLTFSLAPRLGFYLQAGPYLGIMLNAKNITSGTSAIYIDSEGTLPIDAILQQAQFPTIGQQSFAHTENITPDVHRINVGGQGAAGFAYSMGSGKLFLEGGGNYGFIPIQKDDANGNNNTGAGTVTAGYLFLF